VSTPDHDVDDLVQAFLPTPLVGETWSAPRRTEKVGLRQEDAIGALEAVQLDCGRRSHADTS
jgi:hypothetical protein